MGTMERRMDMRVKRHETAAFKILSENENEKNLDLMATRLQNLSRSGLCAEFDRKLNQGSILRLNFFHEASSVRPNDPIKAFCEVEWSKYDGKGLFITGLHFISIKDEDVARLEAYVAERSRAGEGGIGEVGNPESGVRDQTV